MKRALDGILPPEILERRKRGFGAPIGAWLKRDLQPMLLRLLSKQAVERRGLFSWPAIEETMALHFASREDHTDHLLALLNLEIWRRSISTGGLRPTLPRSLPRRSRRSDENSLRLPSLSLPARARRQDPAVQHDPAPRPQARGGGRLAGALGGSGRGRPRYRRPLRRLHDGPGECGGCLGAGDRGRKRVGGGKRGSARIKLGG